MNFIQNRTWFMMPTGIAMAIILFWGYREIIVKVGSLLAILQFALAVLMCICFNIYVYYKLQKITMESAESQLKAMREEEE